MKPTPASSTITIPSNRIYLDELSADDCRAVQATRDAYCMALGELYNCKYNHTFLNKPCHNDTAYIKAWLYSVLGVTPMEYYITSLQAQANGMVSSQKELLKLRETEYQARVEARDKKLKALQDENKLTELIMRQEEVKTLPFGEVWNEYCKKSGVPTDSELVEKIEEYEKTVLKKRV